MTMSHSTLVLPPGLMVLATPTVFSVFAKGLALPGYLLGADSTKTKRDVVPVFTEPTVS